MSHAPRLLLFNLVTDDADPVLSFASDWIRVNWRRTASTWT